MPSESIDSITSAETADLLLKYCRESSPADELLPYYTVWLRFPVLGAVFAARDTLKYVAEIRNLWQLPAFDRLTLNLPCPDDPVVPQVDFILSEDYYDSKSNLFRFFLYDEPNLHALDLALRMISPKKESISFRLGTLIPSIASRCAKFIEESYVSGEYGYGLKPSGPKDMPPTVFSNLAAISSMHSLNIIRPFIPELPKIDWRIGSVLKAVLDSRFTFENDDIFAFKRRLSGKEEPCLATTAFGYRIFELGADILNHNGNSKNIAIGPELSSKSKKTLKFIGQCWDPLTGGFRMNADERHRPNVIYTAYALQLIRELLIRGDIKKDDVELPDLAAVLRFLIKSFSKFGFSPLATGDSDGVPSLYSERSVLNAWKLCELFRKTGYYKPKGDEYRSANETLFEILETVVPFVSSCIDFHRRVCYAEPISLVRSWQYPLQNIVSTTKNYFDWSKPKYIGGSYTLPEIVLTREQAKNFAYAEAALWYHSLPVYGLHKDESERGKQLLKEMAEDNYRLLEKKYKIID